MWINIEKKNSKSQEKIYYGNKIGFQRHLEKSYLRVSTRVFNRIYKTSKIVKS